MFAGWPRVAGSVLLALALLVGDAGRSLELPPASAPPEVVLDAYLLAFEAGDCEIARELWVGPYMVGGGDLCGAADLGAFRILDVRSGPVAGQVIFSTRLTTGGSYDGSLPSGEIPWDFYLIRQPNGAWRIWAGGWA